MWRAAPAQRLPLYSEDRPAPQIRCHKNFTCCLDLLLMVAEWAPQ